MHMSQEFQTQNGLSNGVLVKFTASNPAKEAYELNKANTPMEGLLGDILTVSDGVTGEALPYLGAMARRSHTILNTEVIPADGEISKLVDLTDSYDLKEFKNYTVAYGGDSIVVDVGELVPTVKERDGKPHPTPKRNQKFSCNTALQRCEYSMDVGTDYKSCETACKDAPPTPQMSCSSTQTSQINTAQSQAVTQISRGRSVLSGGSSSLYTTWFGSYSTTNHNRVTGDFAAMAGAATKSRYSCTGSSCSSNVYAYVFPSDSTQTIYVCGVFWSVPSERAETIVHELSHFSRIAGTNDYTYGRSSCQSLARSNPTNAIRNADNQCYFGADA
jgi:peptidyl-Lys metalloendopeptidase